MIIKEWRCADHGPFEGSHPICPAMGCSSENVSREFRTAPGFKSDMTKATDGGFDRMAQNYGMSDMSNAHGRTVKGGNVDPTAAIWGKEAIGSQFDSMLNQASTPTKFTAKNGKELYADNMGMRAACKASGLDQKPLPPATIVGAKSDARDRATVVKEGKTR